MLIIGTDANGKTTIQHVDDLPTNYESDEWKAYDTACDTAAAQHQQWTPEQAETYAAYREAQERNFQ